MSVQGSVGACSLLLGARLCGGGGAATGGSVATFEQCWCAADDDQHILYGLRVLNEPRLEADGLLTWNGESCNCDHQKT